LQPYAETCRGKTFKNLERSNKEFLEHLLVFLQTALQNARFNHQDILKLFEYKILGVVHRRS
jgi:hypothetical protein